MIIEQTIQALDLNSQVGVGIKYPIQSSKQSLFAINYETFEQAKDNLLMLISTSVGERIYNPEYGTNLYKFVFSNNDINLIENIQNEIEQKVTQFLPYIILNDIIVTPDEHRIDIIIKYGVSYDSSQSGQLNFSITQ